jgi:hypothetical protein
MMLKFRSERQRETANHENYFDHLVQANCRMTKLDAVDSSSGDVFVRAVWMNCLNSSMSSSVT